MPDKDELEFYRRSMEVRRIAQGIFDEGERKLVLKFVSDCEKLVGEKRRTGKRA